MKRITLALLALFFSFALVSRAEAYVFVGSWDLGDIEGGYNNASNPWLWFNNPQSLSGVEAAAMLFGGNASDYAISTIDANPANINFRAFVDGWGDTTYLSSPAAQDFKLSSRLDGGYDLAPSFSAYVVDHAAPGTYINYAFRIDNVTTVPEPSTLLIVGLTSTAWLVRRRSLRKNGK